MGLLSNRSRRPVCSSKNLFKSRNKTCDASHTKWSKESLVFKKEKGITRERKIDQTEETENENKWKKYKRNITIAKLGLNVFVMNSVEGKRKKIKLYSFKDLLQQKYKQPIHTTSLLLNLKLSGYCIYNKSNNCVCNDATFLFVPPLLLHMYYLKILIKQK